MESIPPRPLYGDTGGDPHFTGMAGQHYDVMGEAGRCYCLLSAPALAVNARFAAFGSFTVIDQLGVMVPGVGVLCDLALDHAGMLVWCNHERVEAGRRFEGGGVLALPRRAIVHAGGYIVEVVRCSDHGEPHPRFGALRIPHLDVHVHPAGSPVPAGELPHGLIGVSSRGGLPVPGGEQGEGVIDAEPGATYRDYEVSSLWGVDFRFNQYRG